MKLLPDDPRLTAYALGEIENPDERREIKEAIAADAELQAAVESIQHTAEWLLDGLAEEVAPELSDFEKARMEQGAPKKGPSWLNKPTLIGLAAALAFAAILIPQMRTYKQQENVPLLTAQIAGDELNRDASHSDNELRYRELNVTIPAELIEGTPVSIQTPHLAPETTEAPRIIVAESGGFSNQGADQFALADAIFEDVAVAGNTLQARSEAKLESEAMPSSPSAAKLAVSREPVSLGPDLDMPPLELDLKAQNLTAYGRGSGGIGGGHGKVGVTSGLVGEDVSRQVKKNLIAEVPLDSRVANTESYDPIEETDFRSPQVAPLSTFSIDVDTASYANVRRFLNQGMLPPADAVRIEELINYFSYADAAPTESLDEGGDPFAVHMAQTYAPWNDANRLLRIALKGYEMPWADRPASNLVFLLDGSGSMSAPNKLPLLKEAMDLLVRRLDQRDRVAIVVYAGASGLVLPSTTANNMETIQHALENLQAGGSTNAGAGIELAYKTARQHFINGANNRVILCTDGDFNVGQTNRGSLADIAEKEAEGGVSLTVLGFGMGNLKDDMLETLSNKGKGSYAYIDSSAEARKVFLEDLASNIFKIAKDVKIQVEFNPDVVQAYRLIGYENRRLKAEDFNNDVKKAGDIGPGHSIVALYEIVPAGTEMELPGVDPLRYQSKAEPKDIFGEMATVKLRYKLPDADESLLIQQSVQSDAVVDFDQASEDVRFGAAVAAFGLRLSDSETVDAMSYREIEQIAVNALGQDPGGHRSEFTGLVRKAEQLSAGVSPTRNESVPRSLMED